METQTPGQFGLSVQRHSFLAAIEGQFGISVQLASNARVQLFDQFGKPVRGATLTISYLDGGTPYQENLSYDFNRPINRSFPEATPVTLSASGPAFEPLTQTVQVAAGSKETFRLVLIRKSTNQLIRRRLAR